MIPDRVVTPVVVSFVLLSCSAKTGDIIDRYRAAACVAPLPQPKRVQPLTREWDHTLSRHDGSTVTIYGYQAVGGRITARNRTGAEHVVAYSGDYVYPSDVRIDPEGRLYVKTSGLAAGLWQETWPFEYDCHRGETLGRLKVDSHVLPPECPRGQQ
jgi:hypothetical protein